MSKDLLVNRLSNRIDVYDKTESQNELLETVYTYDKIKSVWGEILPYKGAMKNEEGSNIADVSYKITIRSGAIPNLNNQMYFIYKGMRFNIDYFHPHFKERNLIEIICTVEVENASDLGVTANE